MTRSHLPLRDYALIGNGQTAALVGRNGSIDWCCWPRFDSPAVFCRLLDAVRGGYFQLVPTTAYEVEREYAGETNVLQTTFRTATGVIRLSDFMPAPSQTEDGEPRFPHRILRGVACLEGEVEFRIDFFPAFNYARNEVQYEARSTGLIAFDSDQALTLATPVPLEQNEQQWVGTTRLGSGEERWFVLTHGKAAEAENSLRFAESQTQQEYQHTLEYWQRWARQCRYQGPYRKLVIRSALVLKLLVFQPSGGLIAAPTTSLPAQPGGSRNWDYRYTWLRDSGLVLDGLQQLGYHEESLQFIDWLEQLCLKADCELSPMFTVTGEPVPSEQVLEHLSGYRDSRPVRIGNGAIAQMQTDVYGHIIDAVVLCFDRMPRPMRPKLWDFLREITDRAANHWQQRDHGPWEIRGPARHYLYSKLYCWVGLDRSIQLAERLDLQADLENWKVQRDALREEILARGYHATCKAFTQTFDSEQLDASALTLALTNFLPINDERVQATIQRIEAELSADGLVYRYRFDDGLPGHDATFTLCSFWLVMNLALAGRLDKARQTFEHICSYANDLGLFSEQIDPDSGDLLGNFPQGFTHLGLIRSALHLHET